MIKKLSGAHTSQMWTKRSFVLINIEAHARSVFWGTRLNFRELIVFATLWERLAWRDELSELLYYAGRVFFCFVSGRLK